MKLLITKKAIFGLFHPAFHHFRHFVCFYQMIQIIKCKWSPQLITCCYIFIFCSGQATGHPVQAGRGRGLPSLSSAYLNSRAQVSSYLYLSYLLRRTLFHHNFVKASFWTTKVLKGGTNFKNWACHLPSDQNASTLKVRQPTDFLKLVSPFLQFETIVNFP